MSSLVSVISASSGTLWASPLTPLYFYSIALQCPEHSLFINCLPACQPSCTDPDGRCVGSSTKGPSTCKEGCVCEPGFVLHDGKCVLRTECGCKDAQGALIPVSGRLKWGVGDGKWLRVKHFLKRTEGLSVNLSSQCRPWWCASVIPGLLLGDGKQSERQ